MIEYTIRYWRALQWGRGISAAESKRTGRFLTSTAGFNGAAA